METHAMLCPACRAVLVPGELECYETLGEHVCNPNGSRPLRQTFVCPRESCQAHQDGVFWADDGEGPYRDKFRTDYGWQDDNPVPFNSYHRAIHFACSYEAEDRELRWGKLMVCREVRYRSNDFGEKVDQRVNYSIYWNNVLWISGVRMLIFVLGQFYSGRGGEQVKQVRDAIEQAKPQGLYKPKWWRKAVKWWFRIFHLDVYQKALEAKR